MSFELSAVDLFAAVPCAAAGLMCSGQTRDFSRIWEILFRTNVPSNVRVGQQPSCCAASVAVLLS